MRVMNIYHLVYMSHKHQGCSPSNSSQHQEEAEADYGHVAEEEAALHESRHVAACCVVIQAVAVHKQACRSTKTYVSLNMVHGTGCSPARGLYPYRALVVTPPTIWYAKDSGNNMHQVGVTASLMKTPTLYPRHMLNRKCRTTVLL